MNIKILIPVYNDWESLLKLLDEINKEIQQKLSTVRHSNGILPQFTVIII